ncbi:sialoadhesin [Carassius gibelio]|uniref:sialoadhesin n=1 Tax=Carassius gibelio TaxID=101364 RepID=UPI0022776345|nr:sialoadhesin [Carassius gibelio]
MGSSALSLTLLLMSLISSGLTQDSPRSTLTVTPDSPVFTGERVILTCVIESDHRDWRYEWWKGNSYIQVSQRLTVDRNTLTIEGSESSDEGQYTCRGNIEGRSVSSQSSSVSLSVKDLPRSTLTVTPDNTVFTGERVILTCVIESNRDWRQRNYLTHDQRYYWTPDWRYEWWKDSVKLQSSDRYTVNTDTLTIRAVTTSDEGQYTCRGQRDKRPNSSQSSSAVSVSVKERPEAVVKVSPDQRVFRGERVTLTCDIQRGRHIQWTYSWFKDGDTSYPYTTTSTAEYSFRAEVYYSGKYSCRGERSDSQRSHISAALTLAVSDSPRSTLTVTPDSPVFTGETVNLKCVIESNHTDWRYEWYKGRNNSVKLQSSDRYTVNTDTLTIRGLNESDRGQFWCRGQRDERPNSSQESERINLSVNVSAASSSLLVTGVVVGSSVCLLFFLSLLLMWRYKKNKDQQRNINQTSVPNQSAQSQLENFPLESADSDHIYDDVTEVNKRDKDDPEPFLEVTYSEVIFKKYISVDKDDTMAESNNVTYSEVKQIC